MATEPLTPAHSFGDIIDTADGPARIVPLTPGKATTAAKVYDALEPLAPAERLSVVRAVMILFDCDEVLAMAPPVPAVSAVAHVRAFFIDHPDREAKPTEVAQTWRGKRDAVQQAMHRMAKAGELIRGDRCRYRAAPAIRLVGDHDATATWSEAKK